MAKLQIKTAVILNHVSGVRRQNYGELKNTGSDTSINVFTILAYNGSQERLNANGYNSTTRYFHDKKYTAYYCFSATLPFSANNSILNSYAKWALFSEPVTNVDNNQWSAGPSTLTHWQSMKSTTIGDTWYLMGGYDAAGDPTVSYCVSLEALASHSATYGSNIWRKLPSLNYSYSCPLNIEGSLLAFGGLDREKKCGVSTIQCYVPETNTWVAAGELPLGVYNCTCIMTSGKLYMFGGQDAITVLKSTYTTDIQF